MRATMSTECIWRLRISYALKGLGSRCQAGTIGILHEKHTLLGPEMFRLSSKPIAFQMGFVSEFFLPLHLGDVSYYRLSCPAVMFGGFSILRNTHLEP